MNNARFVVLTNHGSLFGKKVLGELISRQVLLCGIVTVEQPLVYYRKLFSYVQKRVGTLEAVYFSLKRIFTQLTTIEPKQWKDVPLASVYRTPGVPVHKSRGTNSPATVAALRHLAPDVLVLAQTGIVKSAVLGIPKIGCLNAHPGILPYYRGIDCTKWAVLNGDFDCVGASVHWVDRGVDTGRVIATQVYEFCGTETLKSVEEELDDRAIRILGDVTAAISEGKIPLGEVQKKSAGGQYFKMSIRNEARARRKLAQFLARRRESLRDGPDSA